MDTYPQLQLLHQLANQPVKLSVASLGGLSLQPLLQLIIYVFLQFAAESLLQIALTVLVMIEAERHLLQLVVYCLHVPLDTHQVMRQ